MQPGGFSLWSCSSWSGELSVFLYDKQFAVKLIPLQGTVNNSNNKIQLRKISEASMTWLALSFNSSFGTTVLWGHSITNIKGHAFSLRRKKFPYNFLIRIYCLYRWNNSIQLLFYYWKFPQNRDSTFFFGFMLPSCAVALCKLIIVVHWQHFTTKQETDSMVTPSLRACFYVPPPLLRSAVRTNTEQVLSFHILFHPWLQLGFYFWTSCGWLEFSSHYHPSIRTTHLGHNRTRSPWQNTTIEFCQPCCENN